MKERKQQMKTNNKERADLKRKFEFAQLETNELNILAAQLKSKLKLAFRNCTKVQR